jgi:hypothetical protein
MPAPLPRHRSLPPPPTEEELSGPEPERASRAKFGDRLQFRLSPRERAIIAALGERWFPGRQLRDAAVVRKALELAAAAEGIEVGEER